MHPTKTGKVILNEKKTHSKLKYRCVKVEDTDNLTEIS